MKNTVILILNIVVVLFAAAAVFLSANHLLIPGLAALIAGIVIFILKTSLGGLESENCEKAAPHYDRNEKYMRLCPRCGFIGSQRSGESVPPCPKCGSLLIATDTTLPEYTGMKEKQRTAWKRRWLS